MPFVSTRHILRRVEAALRHDLAGGYSPSTSEQEAADADVNSGLEPLTNYAVRVQRYVLEPIAAGDLYATAGDTRTVVGYSFGSQTPSEPRTGSGKASRRTMPVEVSIIRAVAGRADVLGGESGYDIDDMMDHVLRCFTSGRRQAPDFGAENMSVEPIRRLEGGTPDALWHGRTVVVHFTRSIRDLLT